MSLGQIPGGNLRAYYRLQGLTDSSGNGYTLTNNNSVPFNAGKFLNGADFGSSGTTKGLTYGSNIFSTLTPNNVYISFFIKFNSTSNTASDLSLFATSSRTDATTGRLYTGTYGFSGGVCTIKFNRLTTGATQIASCTFSPSTSNWYFIICLYDSSIPQMYIAVFDSKMKVLNAAVNTSGLTGASSTASPTVLTSIGNARGLTTQCFAIINEFIIDEDIYTYNSLSTTDSDRVKYRTQAIGLFCI